MQHISFHYFLHACSAIAQRGNFIFDIAFASSCSDCISFPAELHQYGLTEEVLKKAFLQPCQDHETHAIVCWPLNEIPTVGFYRELYMHNFLRKWPPSRSVTKTAIGNFRIRIDPELRRKNASGRLDNIFQFIRKVAFSDKPHAELMWYGLHATIVNEHLQTEVSGCLTEIEELSAKIKEQEQELIVMKREVEIARAELDVTIIQTML